MSLSLPARTGLAEGAPRALTLRPEPPEEMACATSPIAPKPTVRATAMAETHKAKLIEAIDVGAEQSKFHLDRANEASNEFKRQKGLYD